MAAKAYENPQGYSTEEFLEDLKRVKYIKKLLTRYVERGELKERLILNHLIVMCNVFGPEMTVRIVFLKMKDNLPQVKPFLELLQILPRFVRGIGKDTSVTDTDAIEMDDTIVQALRAI